jgi:putative endonuclease
MKKSELRSKLKPKHTQWYVYLLECKDGSYYCGITTNLDRRIAEHNAGKGAKYTRGRCPVRLLEAIKLPSHGKALQVEAAVKKQQKAKKIDFLKSKGFIDK